MVGRALNVVAALALGLSARKADAHGAVTIPKPREAIDGDTAPWGAANRGNFTIVRQLLRARD